MHRSIDEMWTTLLKLPTKFTEWEGFCFFVFHPGQLLFYFTMSGKKMTEIKLFSPCDLFMYRRYWYGCSEEKTQGETLDGEISRGKKTTKASVFFPPKDSQQAPYWCRLNWELFMIIEAEPAWLLCCSSFLFGSLFLFVVVARLLRLHESVAFVLDDVLVTIVKKRLGVPKTAGRLWTRASFTRLERHKRIWVIVISLFGTVKCTILHANGM